MCGIAGMIGEDVSSESVDQMLNLMVSRGNNAPRKLCFKRACIGNVLLDITDHNNGFQPIGTPDGKLYIVFNGEIYNYKKLRSELIYYGYKFITETDTEVLLYMYEMYAEKCLDRIDGMFAFAIYDEFEKRLFLARDQIGIKPLYYGYNASNFYFSSEAKSLIDKEIDKVCELLPGSYLKKDKSIVIKRYYDLKIKINDHVSLECVAARLREKIDGAVKKRVQTELPVCVFFSGGIDSAIILYYALKYHNNITALILGHYDSKDVRCAKKYCDSIGVKYIHTDFIENELLSMIPNTIYRIESFEINPVRGSVLSMILSKVAHDNGFKIGLCGEGADELFCGYGDFINIHDNVEFLDYSLYLLRDVYRTQLLRVDKTSMTYALEVRVPYFDLEIIDLAMSLKKEFKIGMYENVEYTKYILRYAFKDILPAYIVKRPKMTLMKGAGADDVDPDKGIFKEYSLANFSNEMYTQYKYSYPTYNIENLEAAYYFSIFCQKYSKLKFSRKRTVNAKVEIKSD